MKASFCRKNFFVVFVPIKIYNIGTKTTKEGVEIVLVVASTEENKIITKEGMVS